MSSIRELYNKYNKELRPLISEVEGRIEYFEEPLLENIASEFDALALSTSCSEEFKLLYIEQADKFLDISISQSYQYIIKYLDEKMCAFEKRCDISKCTIIDNGKFYNNYVNFKNRAVEYVRKGRKKDDFIALGDYKIAYDEYSKIEELIDSNLPLQVIMTTKKTSIFSNILLWFLSIIISVIIGKLAYEYSNVFFETIEKIKLWMNI
jgi:hypothetical protein